MFSPDRQLHSLDQRTFFYLSFTFLEGVCAGCPPAWIRTTVLIFMFVCPSDGTLNGARVRKTTLIALKRPILRCSKKGGLMSVRQRKFQYWPHSDFSNDRYTSLKKSIWRKRQSINKSIDWLTVWCIRNIGIISAINSDSINLYITLKKKNIIQNENI